MPSGRPNTVTPVLHLIMRLNPKSILDIGVGFGKWGFLFREYLDIWHLRIDKKDWATKIDGIEAYEPYITEIQRSVYDEIYLGPAETVIDKLGTYDVVHMGDVLEHFEKPVGIEFLKKCWDHCKTNIIINTPVNPSNQKAVCGNKYETHRSSWTADEISKILGVSGQHRVVDKAFLVYWANKPASYDSEDFVVCTVKGPSREARLVFPRGDHITRVLARTKAYYEGDLLDAIKDKDLQGTYADIGAHHGNHTAYFALECPSERVVCVEPNPVSFKGLRATIEENEIREKTIHVLGAVHPSWKWVRSTPPQLEPGAVPNSGMSSIAKGDGPDGCVPAMTLDHLLLPYPKVSVVKVDVWDGRSFEVVRSGVKLYKRDHPLMAVEIVSKEEYKLVDGLLSSFGYTCGPKYGLTPTYLWEYHG